MFDLGNRLRYSQVPTMPIIKSAKKRAKTSQKATIRNAKTKRSMKTALKAFAKSPSAKTFNASMSEIDTATKKNIIHKNKAARLKRQLAAAGKKSSVKPAAGVKPVASAKKPATKAPAKKTTTTKKTAAKKPAPKKPAAKKAPAPKKK